MQRRHVTIILVLVAALTLAGRGWAGDKAAKSAADDLDKGYQAAKRGYWQEAMVRYDHASKTAPGNAEIWSNLAVVLEAVGRYDDAGEAYRRALEIEPGNRKIRRNYALYSEFYSTYIERDDEEKPEVEPPDGGVATTQPSDDVRAKGAGDVSQS